MIKQTTKVILSFTISMIIFLCAMASPLHAFKAIYTVNYYGIPTGTVVRTLIYNKNMQYAFKSHTYSTIPFTNLEINEISAGEWATISPIPLKYKYNYKLLSKKRFTTINFDWIKRLAHINKNGNNTTLKLPPLTQDRLSYQLALRQDLQQHLNPLSYSVLNRNHISTYTFKQVGSKILNTKLGKINTIILERANKKDSHIIFWLAPKYNYLLVKILYRENKKTTAIAKIESYKLL